MNKKLAFGLMRLPVLDNNDESTIDIDQAKKMVDLFTCRGFTYFDTAWMYHGFKSENAVKEILTSRYPREAYTITTKLHAAFFDDADGMEQMFQKQLEKTGVDYFDYYLLHDMNSIYYEKYKKYDAFSWIREKKEQGLIKHYGFSFHDTADVLDKILTEHPDFEFVQLQLNYLDWESPSIQSRLCYEVARKHGKDIFVMEPVKGGVLAMLPAAAEEKLRKVHPDWSNAEWAIKFVASLPGVKRVLSGMSDLAQVEDNTSYMIDFENDPYGSEIGDAPPKGALTDTEINVLKDCVNIINADIKIPCTGCGYCTDGCAKNIPIPIYFSLYNAQAKEDPDGTKAWTSQTVYYEHVSGAKGGASDCIGCEQCELICPQHLPVINYLKDVAEVFEK